jgi:hypothetical protein
MSVTARTRRIADITCLLAISAAVFGMHPAGILVGTEGWREGADVVTQPRAAGGWSLVFWAVLQVITARLHRDATTRGAIAAWIASSLAIDIFGGMFWVAESFTLSWQTPQWPAHITASCVGAVIVLVVVVLPVVRIASRTVATTLPPARAS